MKKLLLALLLGLSVIHMGFVDTLDVATPAGTDDPTEGDDRIREFKRAWVERFDVDHKVPASGSTYDGATVGYHDKVTFYEQSADPSNIADTVQMYSKNDGSESSVYIIDESGNVKQITQGDNLRALLNEDVSAPSTAANVGAVYTKDSGTQTELYFREESDGDEVQITSGGYVNGGVILQNVFDQTQTAGSDANANVAASTDPFLVSEGTQIFSKAITPNASTNYIRVRVTAHITHNATGAYAVLGLFNADVHSTNAVAVSAYRLNGNNNGFAPTVIEYTVLASSLDGTNETTFTVRYGGNSGTVYLNQNASGALWDGKLITSIQIEEIKV